MDSWARVVLKANEGSRRLVSPVVIDVESSDTPPNPRPEETKCRSKYTVFQAHRSVLNNPVSPEIIAMLVDETVRDAVIQKVIAYVVTDPGRKQNKFLEPSDTQAIKLAEFVVDYSTDKRDESLQQGQSRDDRLKRASSIHVVQAINPHFLVFGCNGSSIRVYRLFDGAESMDSYYKKLVQLKKSRKPSEPFEPKLAFNLTFGPAFTVMDVKWHPNPAWMFVSLHKDFLMTWDLSKFGGAQGATVVKHFESEAALSRGDSNGDLAISMSLSILKGTIDAGRGDPSRERERRPIPLMFTWMNLGAHSYLFMLLDGLEIAVFRDKIEAPEPKWNLQGFLNLQTLGYNPTNLPGWTNREDIFLQVLGPSRVDEVDPVQLVGLRNVRNMQKESPPGTTKNQTADGLWDCATLAISLAPNYLFLTHIAVIRPKSDTDILPEEFFFSKNFAAFQLADRAVGMPISINPKCFIVPILSNDITTDIVIIDLLQCPDSESPSMSASVKKFGRCVRGFSRSEASDHLVLNLNSSSPLERIAFLCTKGWPDLREFETEDPRKLVDESRKSGDDPRKIFDKKPFDEPRKEFQRIEQRRLSDNTNDVRLMQDGIRTSHDGSRPFRSSGPGTLVINPALVESLRTSSDHVRETTDDSVGPVERPPGFSSSQPDELEPPSRSSDIICAEVVSLLMHKASQLMGNSFVESVAAGVVATGLPGTLTELSDRITALDDHIASFKNELPSLVREQVHSSSIQETIREAIASSVNNGPSVGDAVSTTVRECVASSVQECVSNAVRECVGASIRESLRESMSADHVVSACQTALNKNKDNWMRAFGVQTREAVDERMKRVAQADQLNSLLERVKEDFVHFNAKQMATAQAEAIQRIQSHVSKNLEEHQKKTSALLTSVTSELAAKTTESDIASANKVAEQLNDFKRNFSNELTKSRSNVDEAFLTALDKMAQEIASLRALILSTLPGNGFSAGMHGAYHSSGLQANGLHAGAISAGALQPNQLQAGMSNTLQGGMASGLQGGMASGLQGGMASGLQGGMASGLQGGMASGLQGGMANGLQSGMTNALQSGMTNALQGGLANSLSGGMGSGITAGLQANGMASGLHGSVTGLPLMSGTLNSAVPMANTVPMTSLLTNTLPMTGVGSTYRRISPSYRDNQRLAIGSAASLNHDCVCGKRPPLSSRPFCGAERSYSEATSFQQIPLQNESAPWIPSPHPQDISDALSLARDAIHVRSESTYSVPRTLPAPPKPDARMYNAEPTGATAQSELSQLNIGNVVFSDPSLERFATTLQKSISEGRHDVALFKAVAKDTKNRHLAGIWTLLTSRAVEVRFARSGTSLFGASKILIESMAQAVCNDVTDVGLDMCHQVDTHRGEHVRSRLIVQDATDFANRLRWIQKALVIADPLPARLESGDLQNLKLAINRDLRLFQRVLEDYCLKGGITGAPLSVITAKQAESLVGSATLLTEICEKFMTENKS